MVFPWVRGLLVGYAIITVMRRGEGTFLISNGGYLGVLGSFGGSLPTAGCGVLFFLHIPFLASAVL